MAWVKLDDRMINHPKIEAIGVVGLGLHVAGLCYANQHLTDGFLSEARVQMLITMDDVDRRWEDERESLEHPAIVWAGVLVYAGVWEKVDRGYQIHDYHHYQPSRKQVEADRAKMRKIKVAAGQQGGKQTSSKRSSKRAADEQQTGKQTNSPVARSPLPDPLLTTTTTARDPEVSKAMKAVENLTGSLTQPVSEAVLAELDVGTSADWIVAACEVSALANVRNWKYTAAVIKRWKVDGFKADRRTNGKAGKPASDLSAETRAEFAAFNDD